MKVLVVGGSGYVGRMVVADALARGHEVTALLRNPDVVTLQHPKLRKVKGDALDPASVREAVRGQDAVIDAIGLSTSGGKRGGGLPRGARTTLFSDSARVLVDAMKTEGVKRLIAMSNVGAGDSAPMVPWLVRKVMFPIVAPFMPAILDDKDRMEPLIMQSGLEWTLARYNGIVGDKPKGTTRVALAGQGKVGMMMTVPDAAKFLVDQLEDRTYVGKAPCVSN